MHSVKFRGLALGFLLLSSALPALAQESSKEIVMRAITEAMIERDPTAIDRYWAEDYIQHNPTAPSGRDAIRNLLSNAPEGARYEMGMVIAQDDLVAVHGRISGLGPVAMIAIDIYRVEDGRIAEHWDVIQAEVLDTVSGNPMFEPMQ